MRRKHKIKSLDELDVLKESEKVLVRVPYKTKKDTIEYICEVENDAGLRLSVEIKPDYSTGIFFDGYDEPEEGQIIRMKLIKRRNISIGGGGNNSLIYGRLSDSVPDNATDIRKEVRTFIKDVSYAIRDVNQMVRTYLRKSPKKIPDNLKKYIA